MSDPYIEELIGKNLPEDLSDYLVMKHAIELLEKFKENNPEATEEDIADAEYDLVSYKKIFDERYNENDLKDLFDRFPIIEKQEV